ncbi:DNA sulfur modification protein DndD [Dehalobacterium formicoaceticum]|uniref:DNA sulfur modification protein DndD n=1 Tax=Dehalobacterium formicoaceticum TaxID=51515 RepID=UPI0031F625D7
MKVISLKMHNFGIYAGTNTLNLSNEKPVILIGGLNGRGKTTILEAILLALYGKRSFAFEESKIAFPKYIARLVNTADCTNTTWVELKFELPADDGITTYKVRREWTTNVSVAALKTIVRKNETLDQLLSENWDVFIEEMLPSAIAPFFFFDGEKISELATADNNDTSMKNSVRALLGINVIDQAIFDIEKIAKAKRKAIKADSMSKEIDNLDKQVDEAESLVKTYREELGKLGVKRKQLESKLKTAEDKFAATGGSLAVNRKELLTKKETLEQRFEAATSAVLEIASGDLPLLLVLPMLQSILTDAEKESEQKSISAALERLPELFQQYEAMENETFNFDGFMNYVKTTAKSEPLVYNLTDYTLFQLRTLCATLGGRQKDEAKQALNERQAILAEIADVENYLSISVNESDASKTYETILKFTAELATIAEQYRVAELDVSQSEAQLEEAKRSRDKVVERVVDSLEAADDTKRILTYCGHTVKVINEYKVRLQRDKTRYLAETMTQCFKQLVSKRELIAEIQIDPQTLDFHYFNSKGVEVNRSTFSAGEKQLLVIAMLWGLGICSRKQLPIIIDTPLARLDNTHRKALINNYFPKASEQTILLSTDSEIQGRYYEMLKPYIDKAYTLVFDDEEHCSEIKEGYFGGEIQ